MSQNYSRTIELLNYTLASVCSQTSPRYKVAVVLNQMDPALPQLPQIEYVMVDFPPPERPKGKSDESSFLYEDKGSRVAVGIAALYRDPNITHIMSVDSDDIVSRRVAEFVLENPTAPGWYLNKGLIYSDLTKLFAVMPHLWTRCGTSNIVSRKLLPIPSSVTVASKKEEVVAAMEPYFLREVLGDHRAWRKVSAEKGTPLKQLPFIGAIWRADTNENASRFIHRQQRFGPIWNKVSKEAAQRRFEITVDSPTFVTRLKLIWWRARNLASRGLKKCLGR